MLKRGQNLAACLFVLFLLISFAPLAHGQNTTLTLEDYKNVLAKWRDKAVADEFLAKLPTVEVEQEGVTRKFYVVEGDLLRTEEEVMLSIAFQASGDRAVKPNGELKIMLHNGRPDFWAKGSRGLTYAVNRKSFPDEASYKSVINDLKAAASAWVNVCPACGLSFTHHPEYDANPRVGQVTFIVSFAPRARGFIASAFFPHYSADRRQVLIAPDYFAEGINRVGILRHELGHVLGYRHEHIEGIIGCYTEDGRWRRLTDYDGVSVMHYFCGNAGSPNLAISELDKKGHIEQYK